MKLRTRLAVHQLERRDAPAVVFSYSGPGGTITVTGDNTPNNIAVIGSGTNLFQVVSGAQVFGPVSASNVTINGGNSSDTISFATNSATLNGTLRINSGFSGVTSDSVTISGQINGGIYFTGSLGADVVNLIGVTAGGSVNSFSGGTGLDTLNVDAASSLSGTFVCSGFDSVTLDGQTVTTVISNQGQGNLTLVTLNGTVAGNLTVIGGNSDDTLVHRGTINGSLTFVAGDAVVGGSFLLHDSTAVTNGSISYVAGNGADVALFAPGTTVNGSVDANLGSGNNVAILSNFAICNGNFNVSATNGDDFVSIDGFVFGRSSTNLGNGANFYSLTGFVAGDTTYQGGNGVDTVIVANAIPMGTFRAWLGAADDIVDLTNANLQCAYIYMGAGDSFAGYLTPLIPFKIYVGF
jgi:hypothetical protein